MPDPSQIRRWCDAARPLFICGLARSGTSMLCAALSRHPDLFALQRPGETFIFIKPRTGLGEPTPPGMREYLGSPESLALMRGRLAEADAAQGLPLNDLDVARLFFHVAAHELFAGRRPLEKTPGHALRLDAVFEAFPQALALVCVRDPVQIIASYRKRLRQAREQGVPVQRQKWLDRSIDEMTAIFQRFAQHVEAARRRHGERLLVVPYGAVTETPEAALRRICAAAGLDYLPALIAPIPVADLGFPGGPIAPRGADHADWVAPGEAQAVRAACAPWLAEWCGTALPA